MDIHLTPEAEQAINQWIGEGLCRTPDEAVAKALDLLKQQTLAKSKTRSSSKNLKKMAGCLAELDVLKEDSVKIQRAMRNEW